MKRAWIGGGLLAALGTLILLGVLLIGSHSPKGWIANKYTRIAADTYRSPDRPLKTAQLIADRYKPDDRAADPTGVYLRYRNAVIGVLPEGRGSRITIDSASRGYARYHSYVGGRWGGPGGSASTFRGGGPGEGK